MMNNEHRSILKNERDSLSRVKLEDLSPFLREYKIFNKYMWKDIRTTEDMLDALPYRGPKAFQNIIEILRKAKYFEEADLLEAVSSVNKTTDNNLYYVMTTSPLGICLIINNVEFDKPKSETTANAQKELDLDRHGSDVDATSLHDFFVRIGFDVIVERNKKASEMEACLKEFSRQDFINVHSLIVIILSHGSQQNNKDVIYGTDFNGMYKSEIYEIFNNKNCELLQNKPKVFFFICCRGEDLDYGVLKNCLPNDSIDSKEIKKWPPNESFDSSEIKKSLPNESIDSIEIIMPSMSDMFVVHSTLPMQVSNRNNDSGTYFCEELIEVLKQYYRKYDLETIIKLVNKNLQTRMSRLYRNIQVAHVETLGVTRKIKFCKTLP